MLREDAPSPGKVSSLASQRRGHAPTPQWPTRARRRRLRSPPRSGYRGRDFLVRVDTDQRSSGQIDARIGRIFAILRPTIKKSVWRILTANERRLHYYFNEIAISSSVAGERTGLFCLAVQHATCELFCQEGSESGSDEHEHEHRVEHRFIQ
jgi:hypothetical protein